MHAIFQTIGTNQPLFKKKLIILIMLISKLDLDTMILRVISWINMEIDILVNQINMIFGLIFIALEYVNKES